MPLILLFHISYIQIELSVIQKLLTDNIFSNFTSPEIISGNITVTISDHLLQFSFVPNILSNPDYLLKKFITPKDPQVKERYHKEYKDYRNLVSNHYFESNWNSIKNTWKGSKSILNIKNISVDISKSITVDGTIISNAMAISNIFKNYFSSFANRRKFHISFSQRFFRFS